MRNFKFKLEAVLNERKRIEDLRLREWTQGKMLLQKMVDQLTSLEQGLSDGITKASELAASTGIGNSGSFASLDHFIAGQKTRIIWKTQEVERATKIVERKRAEYVQARQKHEALEKLKERNLSKHREDAKAQELKQMDDIYIMNGAARRRMQAEDEEVTT